MFPSKTFPYEGSRKKVLFLMAGSLRPNPPTPSSLMAVKILERWKKGSKKNLNGPANYPPPLLMARPLREELSIFLRLP